MPLHEDLPHSTREYLQWLKRILLDLVCAYHRPRTSLIRPRSPLFQNSGGDGAVPLNCRMLETGNRPGPSLHLGEASRFLPAGQPAPPLAGQHESPARGLSRLREELLSINKCKSANGIRQGIMLVVPGQPPRLAYHEFATCRHEGSPWSTQAVLSVACGPGSSSSSLGTTICSMRWSWMSWAGDWQRGIA